MSYNVLDIVISYFIPESLGHRSFGRKITVSAVRSIYTSYKTRFFPRWLEDPNISPEDKRKISELLKKPWGPYIQIALNTWKYAFDSSALLYAIVCSVPTVVDPSTLMWLTSAKTVRQYYVQQKY